MSTYAEKAIEFIAQFRSVERDRRFVLGRGVYAKSVAQCFDIAGFVDDFASETSDCEHPILRSSELPSNSLVVVASMLRPLTACRQLSMLGISHLDYFAFQRFVDEPLRGVAHWDEFERSFSENRERFNSIRRRFVDDESRDTWDRLLGLRLTRDLSFADNFVLDFENQYFEDFLQLERSGEVFADIGAFDGATSLQFALRCPEFSRIHAFEPSPQNRQRVRKNLKQLKSGGVKVHEFGLGDANYKTRFESGRGSASMVSDEGPDVISIRTLDSIGLESITFAKLDIEGFEMPALRGARETLRRCRPQLAVSVYHKALDFIEIPQLVD
jgi:FkbM family methyltransferase